MLPADRRGAVQPHHARVPRGAALPRVRGDAAAARLRGRGGRALRHLAARRHALELPEHLPVRRRAMLAKQFYFIYTNGDLLS